MDALVADIAVTEIPEPVPIVMDQIGVVRLFGRGSEPEIEVQVGGRLGILLAANAPARLATIALGDQQLSILAGMNGGNLFRPSGAAALLGAMLHNAVIAPGRLDASASLADVVTQWLLDIHIFTRLAGPDGHERVPVVGCSDGDGIQLFILQGFADVLDADG